MFGLLWIVYIGVVLLGLALGSYLNSWMWRVHERETKGGELMPPAAHTPLPRSQRGLALPSRSVCTQCRRELSWYENIPLVSFIALRGRCATCGAPIPWDYFLVELGAGVGFVTMAWYHVERGIVNPWELLRDLIFLAILIVVFVYDAKYQLVLTEVAWSGTIIGFLLNYFALHYSLSGMLIGAAVGGGFFLAQYLLSRGRWIGGSDVRLGVLMGIWLGWPNILVALFVSYILGAIVAIPLLLTKKKGMNSAIPFGTFLAVGTLVTMFWGNQVINWYWGLIRW